MASEIVASQATVPAGTVQQQPILNLMHPDSSSVTPENELVDTPPLTPTTPGPEKPETIEVETDTLDKQTPLLDTSPVTPTMLPTIDVPGQSPFRSQPLASINKVNKRTCS